MLNQYLQRVVGGEHLSADDSYQAANLLLEEKVDEIKAAALLAALRTRGEKAEELLGFVHALREHALTVETDLEVLDTCGTGGDGHHTFNISTAVALVVASCGVPVAKHGNRAMTSQVGSADVLEALGVRIDLTPEQALRLLETVGIAFFYAPNFHPIMRKVSGLRRNLGIPTLFNFLGPLLNPCPLTYQLVGVSAADAQETIAHTLLNLGLKRGMVVRGEDGLDEISPCSPTLVYELNQGSIESYYLTSEQFGISCPSLSLLRGGDAATNAGIIRQVLDGTPGAYRETVLVNAAPALVLTGKARDLDEGIQLAAEAIDSGRTRAKLAQLVRESHDGDLRC